MARQAPRWGRKPIGAEKGARRSRRRSSRQTTKKDRTRQHLSCRIALSTWCRKGRDGRMQDRNELLRHQSFCRGLSPKNPTGMCRRQGPAGSISPDAAPLSRGYPPPSIPIGPRRGIGFRPTATPATIPAAPTTARRAAIPAPPMKAAPAANAAGEKFMGPLRLPPNTTTRRRFGG